MAYVVIKRLYHDMLINLRCTRLSQQRAQQRQEALVRCGGQGPPVDTLQDGSVWIDVLNDEGVVIAGPFYFRAEHALTALQQTGCPTRKARELLSDRYAKRWIRRCYQH
ncbi:MAG: hypothetical protein HC828_04815 [Blastochloris sp.]|nr:hypothetical protein [Blastochloris sp.]